ncbi:MAG: type II toxin-antitoxin system VapC family toxin [Dehalococcoidia bacterium]
MTPVVVDASVSLKWLIDEDGSNLAETLVDSQVALHAPSFLRLEVANALVMAVRRKGLDPVEVPGLLNLLLASEVHWHPTALLDRRAVEIALETGTTVYDAAYLALAEVLGADVVTADARLVGRLRGAKYELRAVVLSEWAGVRDAGR